MRIDLPGCSLKNCKKCFDGNCLDKQEYRSCEFAINKSMLRAYKETELVWIPVSERLPDPGTQSILVCLRNGGIFMGISSFLGEFKEISSMGIRSFCMDNQVVAWMQLPEPYQSVI